MQFGYRYCAERTVVGQLVAPNVVDVVGLMIDGVPEKTYRPTVGCRTGLSLPSKILMAVFRGTLLSAAPATSGIWIVIVPPWGRGHRLMLALSLEGTRTKFAP